MPEHSRQVAVLPHETMKPHIPDRSPAPLMFRFRTWTFDIPGIGRGSEWASASVGLGLRDYSESDLANP